jgi:hypothetical protein
MNRISIGLEQRNMKGWRLWTKLLIFFVVLFAVLLVFSPTFVDRYFGVAKNESAAVASLRKINALESQYAAEHPDKGFACELPLLRSNEKRVDPYDPIAALLAGEWSGFKFAVVGCAPDADGIVTHYGVTAVPTNPGRIGIRVFCTDQSGKLFYEETSASQCAAMRHGLPD